MTDAIRELFDLDGKIIIITGAVGLLGRQHAHAVAAFGGIPVLLDLDESTVRNLAEEISKKYNVEALGLSVDITQESQIIESGKIIINKFGKIDGLVNNAANNPKVENKAEKNFSRLENFPLDIWQQDIAVGLTGAFLCAKHYGSHMAKNLNGGSIVNISSDLGIIAPDQRLYRKEDIPDEQQQVKPITYSVVKTALVGLTRYLATYWADKNIRCNALCPGGVENGQDPMFLSKVSSRIPLGRMAGKDEYQGTLVWMLSMASSYLNGAIIPVDGGRTTW